MPLACAGAKAPWLPATRSTALRAGTGREPYATVKQSPVQLTKTTGVGETGTYGFCSVVWVSGKGSGVSYLISDSVEYL